MKNKVKLFWFIVLIVIASIYFIIVKPTKLGLDLVGGSRLMLEAQTSDSVPEITTEIMDSLQYAIGNRVNAMVLGKPLSKELEQKDY